MQKNESITLIGLIFIAIPFFTNWMSVEWEFLFFIAAAILFWIFKIDSRILILPAILTLAFIPFLLINKLESLAETLAIYVYYLLVVGVILQIIEHMKNTKNTFTLVYLLKKTPLNYIHLFTLAGLIGFAILYFSSNSFSKEFTLMFGIYLLFTLLYGISYLLKQDNIQNKRKQMQEL